MYIWNKLKSFEKDRILYASLGSVILAFGLFNIHSQSQISEGGILGLTLLLYNWFSISPSITSAILNNMLWSSMERNG